MTRQSVLASGLLALTLALAPSTTATADIRKAGGPSVPVLAKPAPGVATPHNVAASGAVDAGHSETPEHAPEAGHSSSSQPNILEPQAPLAIWTVVVFGVLLAILAKFAWGPMMKSLHDREEHIEHTLLETEKARNEAERLMAENQKFLAKAAEQVRALLDEARRGAEETANAIIQKAQAEAEASRERAEREIGNAKDQALSEIFTRTTDLAVAVAGKVLARDLSEADHRRLVESATAELPAMAAGGVARS